MALVNDSAEVDSRVASRRFGLMHVLLMLFCYRLTVLGYGCGYN